MKRITELLKSKIFYIALGTGLVAFASLIAVYNYNNTKKEFTREEAIDLNQPLELGDSNQKEEEHDKVTPEELGFNSDSYQPANSDAAKATQNTNKTQKNEDTTTTEASTELTTEETAEVISSEAGVTGEGAIEAGNDYSAEIAKLGYKGEPNLVWPLNGNVILPFSMETTVYFSTLNLYKCNPGMLIQGKQGQNVLSCYEGIVTSIENTREYGTVVTVNLGNGYEAIYGQLMNVCVNEGDHVSAAGTIGEVGPVSSYYKNEGDHLFFEIKHEDTPINPIGLIR